MCVAIRYRHCCGHLESGNRVLRLCRDGFKQTRDCLNRETRPAEAPCIICMRRIIHLARVEVRLKKERMDQAHRAARRHAGNGRVFQLFGYRICVLETALKELRETRDLVMQQALRDKADARFVARYLSQPSPHLPVPDAADLRYGTAGSV